MASQDMAITFVEKEWFIAVLANVMAGAHQSNVAGELPRPRTPVMEERRADHLSRG